MARSFDDGDKQDSNEKRNYSHPLGAAAPPPPPPTETLDPLLPPPLEVIEEVAEEGRHLYLDFIRTEISRNGLIDPCIGAADGNDGSIDPQKYISNLILSALFITIIIFILLHLEC